MTMGTKPTDFQKIYSQIQKNLKNKKWECMAGDCKNDSINSHLLQQNGILNTIAENGYLFEIKPIDVFQWTDKKLPGDFKKISIKQALSLNLFCSNHDTSIFKSIETQPIDLKTNYAPVLFSYRAICAEKRKKEIATELYKRLLRSNTLNLNNVHKIFTAFINSTEEGIRDLDFYQKEFQKAIKDKNYANFKFVTYKYPLIKVYCSATFSPYDSIYTPLGKNILNYIFIHVIPHNENLYIIIGYHIEHVESYMKDYISSWQNLSQIELGQKLTHLFATYVESWGMSPAIYKNISPKTLQAYKDYFFQNSNNLLYNQKINFDLFENNNYGV